MKKAFTLIELLIVVAIIGILAAIAVPNFLNAQIRAKVARVIADLKTVGSACEMYHLDQPGYPSKLVKGGFGTWLSQDMNAEMLDLLTTPVCYIATSRLIDPFGPIAGQNKWNTRGYYQYHGYEHPNFEGTKLYRDMFIVFSFGPDRKSSSLDWIFAQILNNGLNIEQAMGWSGGTNGYYNEPNGALVYNPSNGVQSQGDIGLCGGGVPPGLPMILGG